ncbi:calcium-binding protein [Sphingomonas sp. GCM10030256]|uniref:calcium-binding protein n=1 Tax=Sphingomonas sp. GCM10030256 TaxID=3273427 RepID=UPI0036109E4C
MICSTNFQFVDRFTYTITDAGGLSHSTSVKVTVTGLTDGVTRQGGNGADLLDGTAGEDRLLGDNGKDQLFGLGGHDQLDGGRGDDQLDGGSGHDVLAGGQRLAERHGYSQLARPGRRRGRPGRPGDDADGRRFGDPAGCIRDRTGQLRGEPDAATAGAVNDWQYWA